MPWPSWPFHSWWWLNLKALPDLGRPGASPCCNSCQGTYQAVGYFPVSCVTEAQWFLQQQEMWAKLPPLQTHQALCAESELLPRNFSGGFLPIYCTSVPSSPPHHSGTSHVGRGSDQQWVVDVAEEWAAGSCCWWGMLGPVPHLGAATEARPPKGSAEVRGHPLSQDRTDFAWTTWLLLTFTRERLYTLPPGNLLWIFTILTVKKKNPSSCLP